MSAMDDGGRPLVLPQLRYDDPTAAVAWLCRVFGFTERSRMAGPDGTVRLADLGTPGGGALLVCGIPPPLRDHVAGAFPDRYRRGGEAPWPNLSYSITVMVPDVDAHHDRARRGGAAIVAAPQDQPWGLRDYEALDLEGRCWNFSRHLRTTLPEAWGAAPADQDR
jgi:uncharacterized glyoxalase superfamily protein PhnB